MNSISTVEILTTLIEREVVWVKKFINIVFEGDLNNIKKGFHSLAY